METVQTIPALRAAVQKLRANGRRVALVPTMGALHDGHISLVAAGQREADAVVTSIFVNPLQFLAGEDLDRYPRDEAGDLAKLRAAGCDLVWLPSVEAMYPPGRASTITMAGPAEGWEGAARPGHFNGVATVCTKLFLQTGADVALFGEKDWQQYQVIRRVVRDLDIPIRIIGCPTVREADGLAMSSRNRFLTAEQRALAPLLQRCMADAAQAIGTGAAATPVLAEQTTRLNAAGFAVDYLALVDAESMQPIEHGPGRLIAAAKLGTVRLLDNIPA